MKILEFIILLLFLLLEEIIGTQTIITVNNIDYTCNIKTYKKRQVTCATNNVVVTTLNVDKNNYIEICATKCLKYSIKNTPASSSCHGFIYDESKNSCTLQLCSLNDRKTISKRNKQLQTIEVNCNSKSPTSSPTNVISPIDEVTSVPTSSNIGGSISGSGTFQSPTGIPETYPIGWNLYKQILPDLKLCEVVIPEAAQSQYTFDNFLGSLGDCVKECTYDSECMFVIYSPIDKICTKTVLAEITDDDTKIDNWINSQYSAYVKLSFQSVIPYLNGMCSDYKGVSLCHNPECAWDKGKKGYNNMPEQGGWCGRIKCFASPIQN